MNRRTCALVVATCLGVGSGCGLVTPKPPPTVGSSRATYSQKSFEDDQKAYALNVQAGTQDGIRLATFYRDRMLWSVVSDVDFAYSTFRNDFHGSRAGMKTAADVAKLGMAAASTVLGGSAALSAAITALQGSQLSVEKNFLEEQTTEALLTTMDALRQEQKANIQLKLKLPPPSYSFEEAFDDALALFTAGTVPSALQRIASQAGKQNADAEKAVKDNTEERVQATLPQATQESLTLKRRLNATITRLVDHHDIAAMKRILQKRGVAVPANASDTEVTTALGGELRKTRTTTDMAEMLTQLRELGLEE